MLFCLCLLNVLVFLFGYLCHDVTDSCAQFPVAS